MREIKFKAWDKKESVMLRKFPDSLFMKHDGSIHNCVSMENDLHVINFTKNYELLQYTGLKDKNGVEIFEGDILKAGDGYIGLIGYRSESARFVGFNIGNEFTDEEFDTLYTANGSFNSAEVIGNRYENPELLKEEPTC